jgi:ABC-type transporter Mla subunit MlaD
MSGSSPLFVSFATPPPTTANLQEEVENLVALAEQAQVFRPEVQGFLNAHREAFIGVLTRQIELIKSRSQNFKNGQVTIFDKALLILTAPPKPLLNAAAVEFFCAEFLNINLREMPAEITHALGQSVVLPERFKQGK